MGLVDRIGLEFPHQSLVNGCHRNLENPVGVVHPPEEVADAERDRCRVRRHIGSDLFPQRDDGEAG